MKALATDTRPSDIALVGAEALPGRHRPRRVPRPPSPRVALSTLALLVAVVVMVADYRLARHATGDIIFVGYWAAFALAVSGTFGLGLARSGIARPRLALALFGAFLFVPKFMMSVSAPVYFDEYGQFRHVMDALAGGDLFTPIAYQPIISDFPGLPAATIAVHEITRLSVWHSGQLVVLVAHSAALMAVFAIARTVGASRTGAFVAGFVYALNPSYSFFDTQFSYESLGLPLALVGIAGCLKCVMVDGAPRQRWSGDRWWSADRWWPAVGLVALVAATLTHHLSALFGDVFCIMIMVAFSIRRWRGHPTQRLAAGWGVAVGGSIASTLWLSLVATSIGSYLAPHFGGSASEILQLIGIVPKPATVNGYPPKRVLFGGTQLPIVELGSAVATPFVAFLLLAGVAVVLWRRHGRIGLFTAPVLPFALLAAAYFVSMPVALTDAGAEIAHRSWGYSYLGIAVVVALAADRVRWWRPRPRRWIAAGAILLALPLTVGNVALGVDVSYRFPGPYEFGTDTRTGNPELTGVVRWLQTNAPAGAGVVTDRFTSEYVTAYTDLRVPTPTQVLPLGLFAAPLDPPPELIAALRQGDFSYFVVDEHIFTETPLVGFYDGYDTFMKVDIPGLEAAQRSPILRLVYATDHYRVYRIDLAGTP